ncbi:MAG: phenylalanine--tRNA ligase subunit beta [Armatimonadetes bacterium CG_4_10_14_0_8_um_filter_66_14]|nr:phenylalanine--tRNA ligase subunit beta [Armatimonadota bacterium]PIU94820.1 MAG: phenylalanine--tRNA ligase subunit beta [Armatimonadetes bacterium CG06_land_8_20_14_3_00_66_21]PIZ41139.1 MAG: phenylalanine--tRNA ligase subunit beta [Armatimonadetes bacterium CG_4_10_14_0_8_um_filter_66_14]
MKVPLKWLEEYVELRLPLPELCDRLTMAGLTVESVYGAGEEAVLTLEVTSNRGDWLSLLGVAREVAALTGAPFRLPDVAFAEGDELSADSVSVEILDPALGPRYSGRLLRGVTVGPSPAWMQERLQQVGVRPINNIVDVTNYVCFEYGQPLHAFDFSRIAQGKLQVRRARPGESLVTLDGEDRPLTEERLVIADAERPVALAGVMGGLDSEVTDSTTDVLLESAHFASEGIRKTAKALALRSEASYRFERWVDPNGAVAASDRATQLILQTAGGTACKGVVDAYPHPLPPAEVELDTAWCRRVLGVDLPDSDMAGLLARLGLHCEPAGEARLRCTVPTFRNDLHQKEDLVEEVARLYGYNNLPTTVPPNLSPNAGLSAARRLEFAVRDLLRAGGLSEVVSYSLTTPEETAHFGLAGGDDMIALRNPLTAEATHLRTSLLPAILRVLELNSRRRVGEVWAFELGKRYVLGGEVSPARESRRLCLALMGRRATSAWNRSEPEQQANFYALKGVVEELLAFLGIQATYTAATHAALHPHRTASVEAAGQEVGVLGEVHPELAEKLGLLGRAYVAELDFETLADNAVTDRAYASLPRFPSADRDVAFIVDAQRTWREAELVSRESGGELLESVALFDEFRGEQVGAGKRSLACSLRFRHPERTLEEGEADRQVDAVKAALRDKLGAAIRE